MSLLTNEQIMELTGLAINKSPHLTLFDTFHEWNKQQSSSTQFEPDWDGIPEEVVEVQFKIDWLRPDTGDYYEEPFFIKIYNRPLRAHPHAEMIMKYAEVAQRRADPWVEFEVRHTYAPSNTWFKMDINRWISSSPDFEYRHIGDKNA